MRQQQEQNEIQALVVVLFPEFTQVFADPCLPIALTVLKALPSAQAVTEVGVEASSSCFERRRQRIMAVRPPGN